MDSQPLNEVVIIFGRRSGTSTLAKAIYEAGFNLCGPLDLRPLPSNIQGHYENIEVRNINAGILNMHQCSSNMPALMPFVNHPLIASWGQQHKGQTVVKDPNIDLCWPSWYRTLSATHSFRGVWSRRPKEEQVDSLQKWYGDRPDWRWCVEMYELAIYAATQIFPVLEVSLDDGEREEKAISFIKEFTDDEKELEGGTLASA